MNSFWFILIRTMFTKSWILKNNKKFKKTRKINNQWPDLVPYSKGSEVRTISNDNWIVLSFMTLYHFCCSLADFSTFENCLSWLEIVLFLFVHHNISRCVSVLNSSITSDDTRCSTRSFGTILLWSTVNWDWRKIAY